MVGAVCVVPVATPPCSCSLSLHPRFKQTVLNAWFRAQTAITHQVVVLVQLLCQFVNTLVRVEPGLLQQALKLLNSQAGLCAAAVPEVGLLLQTVGVGVASIGGGVGVGVGVPSMCVGWGFLLRLLCMCQVEHCQAGDQQRAQKQA